MLVDMIKTNVFWGLVTIAVLVWYSTVTIYVAIRGTLDIREMLRRLKNRDKDV